jgi:drug/metabolite transporter (DMT)-like permease
MLAGFTGLFGKLITLNEVDIVWYRMFFTSLILIVFTGLPKISLKKLAQLAMCGALLGLHWMMFYGSIKASNVSIGVICYSLVGVFTAIFEPAILKKRFSWTEIAFSLITVLGLLCVFSFDSRYRYGILIGVGSAAISSIYSIFNKKYSKGIKSRTVLFYEMSAGLIIVTAIIPIYTTIFNIHQDIQVIPSGSNLWWMLVPCFILHSRIIFTANSGTTFIKCIHSKPYIQS